MIIGRGMGRDVLTFDWNKVKIPFVICLNRLSEKGQGYCGSFDKNTVFTNIACSTNKRSFVWQKKAQYGACDKRITIL
jgi:hypothetical protein